MAGNRGVAYMGPGKVEVQTIDYPKLALGSRKCEHGVILKIVTTNICGSDQHMVRGRTTAPHGLVLGHEITGEVLEAGRDALMRRTRRRPLPARRIGRGEAVAWGLIASAAGLFLLAVFGNMLTAGLGLANILIYLLIYTPLKPRTPANTLVGAVVGALPPMMGWTAATGSVGTGACVLGAILFIWQVPHFLALAWSNRADYAAGGFRMLPSVDPSGRITGALVLVHCLALPPITLALTLTGLTDGFYAAGALVLGLWLAWLGLQLRRRCDQENARRVFLASVMYLPLLLVMMTADRLLRGAMPVH